MSTPTNSHGIQTRAIHGGTPDQRFAGAINVPIFQSSVYETKDVGDYSDIVYPRLSTTPTHKALGQKLASLENAEFAFATASGMAAISATLMSLVRAGDHVVFPACVYGGTF